MYTNGTVEERKYDNPAGLVDYTLKSSGAVLRGIFYIFGGKKGESKYRKVGFFLVKSAG